MLYYSYENNLGAGFFSVMNNILSMLYNYYIIYNKNIDINIDWSNVYFPYNDSENINIFNKYFTSIKNTEDDLYINDYLNNINKYPSFNIYVPNDIYKYYDIKDWIRNRAIIITKWRQIKLIDNTDNELVNIKKKHIYFLNKMFFNNFIINIDIINSVNEYYELNMRNYFIIGVHIRSSNHHNCENMIKSENNELITFQEESNNDIIKNIDNYILQNNINNFKIYLSTDVEQNIQEFKIKYMDKLLYNKDNLSLSSTNSDIESHFGFEIINRKDEADFLDHFIKNKPGYKGGFELLKDCLLLSRCNIFRPALSNLSDWVYIFNPKLNNLF